MKRNIYLSFLLQICVYQVFSQDIEMSGTIMDSKTQAPIEFVNIGIQNKNKGTISNLEGKFLLEIPQELSTDSLTISHVNYETLKIPIRSIKDKTLYLEPKTNELAEVIISNKKKRHSKVGVKSYNPFLSAPIISKDMDVIEAAQRINIPSKSVKINYVNMYLLRGFKIDSSYIRINFYKNVDDAPGEKIIFQNIVQHKRIEPGWIQMDLTSYNIYLDEDFFVSVEFITDFKNPYEINLGGILTKGKGYFRKNSQGSWYKVPGAYSINVEIEY
ncbi:carboxypeptidase-like regulatory domain-containing protein [Confluentibacter citreus]|uniref:carboxypeptidase-like regulatory domain-containing protein n=1 Tax=Confluentibacter citreus TaxID=2007307 RepID=UPI000C28888B|nr:carboxypeptidase-like regulatory domain-containing protein [Confluentibacter citreus]